jgi:predicted membrane channel-forming protein YqfA (hemolysin III family)
MKRYFSKGNAAAVVLFGVAALLFNWPLLSIPAEQEGLRTLLYVFLAWGFVILCLVLHARDQAASPSDKQGERERQ